MTNEVTILMTQDAQRCDKIIAYSQSIGQPIYQSVEQLISLVSKADENLNITDVTLAINIADAIYNYLP